MIERRKPAERALTTTSYRCDPLTESAQPATLCGMTKTELRAATDLLHAILARVEAGELTAPKRVVARLEGAEAALEAVGQRASGKP